MRFCSLSSCSQFGNAYLVEAADGTRVLVDVGVRIRRLEQYLAEVGVEPASISAIFMTHDHADHVAALTLRTPFPNKHRIPVFATGGFWRAFARRGVPLNPLLQRTLRGPDPVQVGPLTVRPFAKPHDAPDPVSYVIGEGEERLAVVTDLGHVPREAHGLLSGCDYYIFESNHDREMELGSGRSWDLIQRVVGDWGHLSNLQAAEALAALAGARTREVVLAHLSLDCNTPDLARATVHGCLQSAGFRASVTVAPPDRPSPWFAGTTSNTPKFGVSGI